MTDVPPPSYPPLPDRVNPQQAFAAALRHHEAGRLDEADAIYRNILRIAPDHADALHLLGVVEFQRGRHDAAIDLIGHAIALSSGAPVPAFHNNIALAFRAAGQPERAIEQLRRATEIDPDYADALVSLGALLQERGDWPEAETNFRKALSQNPNHVDAHYNLATVLMVRRQWRDAADSYMRAIQLQPALFDAHLDLAKAFIAMGDMEQALNSVERAIELRPTQDARDLFVYCLKGKAQLPAGRTLPAMLIRALTEPWARPSDLTNIGASIVKQAWSPLIQKTAASWPARPPAGDILADPSFGTICNDRLTRALLEAAPVCDIALERFLTVARHALLEVATDPSQAAGLSPDILTFYCSLAQQCFIDDYVFALTDGEFARAQHLWDEVAGDIAAGRAPVPTRLIAAAAYFPLYTLPGVERLLTATWHDPIDAILTQQIREPSTERRERMSIRALTPVDDEISRQVRDQYEESPYPRWMKAAPIIPSATVGDYLRRRFPLAPLFEDEKPDPDILIAGCGTGQNPIETARRFPDARILAVDLSLTSLAYARRKSMELGIPNIEFAQADILGLPALGRVFDVIEANGVLHHLADPWTGWRTLLSLLRPGGSMRVGLYSAVARRDIAAARSMIAARGYQPTPDGIRLARQDLIAAAATDPLLARILYRGDFFSINECRDMLFHVQEHRLNLRQIRDFIAANGLIFIGFDLDPARLRQYQDRSPRDAAMTELENWCVFEDENPDIFISMYQFWVQKPAV